MTFIPAFEIGVWNAWIFMAYSVLALFLPNLILNADNMKAPAPQNQTEKRYRNPWAILCFLTIIYSIFLPLKLGTMWYYIGMPICLVGAILYMITSMNFAMTTIRNEPVIKGLYRYSRHPMYVTLFLMFLGLGIASASWIVLLFAIISMALWVPLSISEEQFCLEQYGDAYREYMDRTPRWIGIPKS